MGLYHVISRAIALVQPFNRPRPTHGLEADREWLETRNRWRREAERHGRSEQAWKALNARTHALLKSPVAR